MQSYLCPRHEVIRGGVEVHLHSFLTSTLDGGQAPSRHGCYTPRKEHTCSLTGKLGAIQSLSGPSREECLVPAGSLSRLRDPGSYSTGVTEQNYERAEACVGHLVVYLSL